MTPDLDLALLRSLVATAHSGSLNRAATTLGLTQPAVSQQLRRLERALGAELLQRSTRGVVLTSSGTVALRYAERVLALVDELERATGSDVAPGVYRVGLLEDVVAGGLTAVLADFAAVHPDATVDVVVAEGAALGRGIDDGELDLVIGDPRSVGTAAGGPWRRAPFRLVWVAHPRLDLTTEPLPVILFHAPCVWRDAVIGSLAAAGRRWRAVLESSSLGAVQAAVAAGLGVSALLPGTVPAGTSVIESAVLPDAPDVELALYRRRDAVRRAGLDRLEALLWRTLG